MTDQSPIIELSHVGFSYRVSSGRAPRLTAVADVSLSVGTNEVVAMIGPSGCGKSTLLNIVTGLLTPTRGTVAVQGVVGTQRLGMFSYMPQRDSLLPWRTCVDNAALLLEVEGWNRTQATLAAQEMLEKFGLAQFAGELPANLSVGMRQRVALVRTFLPNKHVLLDEPLSALDAITRGELHEFLLGLQAATGRSMLMVTHDIEEAILLSNRVIVMSQRPGRIVDEVIVQLAGPRTWEVTTTPEFASIKKRILDMLRRHAVSVAA